MHGSQTSLSRPRWRLRYISLCMFPFLQTARATLGWSGSTHLARREETPDPLQVFDVVAFPGTRNRTKWLYVSSSKPHGACAVEHGCRCMGGVWDPLVAAPAVRMVVDQAAGLAKRRRTTCGHLCEPGVCAQRCAVCHRHLLVDADARKCVRMERHQPAAGGTGCGALSDRTGAQRRHLSCNWQTRRVLRMSFGRKRSMARWIPIQYGATSAVRGCCAHRLGDGVFGVSNDTSWLAWSGHFLDHFVHHYCLD